MFKFKRKAMKVTTEIRDTTIAEVLATLTDTREAMAKLDLKEEQRGAIDYYIKEIDEVQLKLRKEWYYGLD